MFKMRVNSSTQKQNEKAMHSSYKAIGDSISFTSAIHITEKSGFVDSFRKVDIVLCISRKDSYIEIDVQDKDISTYKSFQLKRVYHTYETEMEFQQFRDYQTTNSTLRIKPLDSDYTIIIDLKKN
jgi:hypothetical protein